MRVSVSRRLPDPLVVGYAFAAILGIVALIVGLLPPGSDISIYWSHRLPDPYDVAAYGQGGEGFFYAPVFAQVFAPLTALPLNVVAAGWLALEMGALYLVAGRWSALLLVLPPVALELRAENIHLLLAAVVVYGLRHPALWSFALLTKVTPGIGLVWFAVRREWRHLAVALLATGVLVAVSYVLAPDLWPRWIGRLLDNAGAVPLFPTIAVPLLVRLPIAVGIVAWGARTDRRWTLAAGTTLAIPVLWWNALATLVAVLPDRRT